MVVRTTSLNSMKNFLPKIHTPLPLSRRESQQLLDSITTSFRRNLDKEHPWEHSDESASHPSTSQSRKPVLSTTVSSSPTPSDTLSRQRPTDRHLRAILSNPLFAHEENKEQPAATTRGPLNVFDSAVSRGLMTPRRAAGFLAKVRSQIVGNSPEDIQRGMAGSGAGVRVVQWIRSSGLEKELHLFVNSRLFAALIPFMYAEGLQEVAWDWVRNLGTQNETEGVNHERFHTLSTLLYAIVKQTNTSTSGLKTSLDGPYEAMIRANSILPRENRVALKSFKNIWGGLSWASTVFASERPKPSAPLFDSFVDIGRPLKLMLDLAHLELHHPLAPDHSSAVQFMHHNANLVDLRPTTRRRLVCMALDTTDRLKEVGDIDEVSWVERFLTRIGNDLNAGFFNALEKDLIASELPIYRMD